VHRGFRFRVAAGIATACLAVTTAGAAPDRLERFGEIARSGLATIDVAGVERATAALREIYELIDDEIVESLGSGGVFASQGYLQDRLDAFNAAWGATALRVVQHGSVLVGAFRLSDALTGNSVRVYGQVRGEAVLLGAIHHDGAPTVYPLPPASSGAGAAQFLVVWAGATAARGTQAVRVELIRLEGEHLKTVWTPPVPVADEPIVRSYRVRDREVLLRYELQYPGWAPGCAGQAEQEDVFRYAPAQRTFVLARRQVHGAAHRKFHAVVERVLSAVNRKDERALVELVPDARLRARLPITLVREAACDASDPANPTVVSVAVTAGQESRPWTLSFRRAGAVWRLISADPVL
jgi:hypothetical protein